MSTESTDDSLEFGEEQLRESLKAAAADLRRDYQALVSKVALTSRYAPTRARKLNRPFIALRLVIVLCITGTIFGFGYFLTHSELSLDVSTGNHVMELAAHIVDIGVVIPLLATVLFVEQRLKRKGILRELEKLERLNDQTYELQFKENPHACEDLGAFNKIMDVCCGILLLVRVAAGAYSSSNDPVVLERIGVIRRGCNDNHRNLMMKMALAQASHQKAYGLSAAVAGQKVGPKRLNVERTLRLHPTISSRSLRSVGLNATLLCTGVSWAWNL